MVVWTGGGVLVLIMWVAGVGLTQLVVDLVYHAGFYTAHAWPKILGCAVSAPFIWMAGRAWNGSPGDERRSHGAAHTLFWVPMEYWGPIFIVVGVVVAFWPAK
jgi:hypothetical protein